MEPTDTNVPAPPAQSIEDILERCWRKSDLDGRAVMERDGTAPDPSAPKPPRSEAYFAEDGESATAEAGAYFAEGEDRQLPKRRKRRRKKGDRRHAKRNLRAYRRAVEKLAAAGHKRPAPRVIRTEVWAAAKSLIWDGSGKLARAHLGRIPEPHRSRVVRAAMIYARCDDRKTLWKHERARRVVAHALSLWRMQLRARRRGFRGVVRGVSRAALAALTPRDGGGTCHISTLFATTHHGTAHPADRGSMRVLELAGFYVRGRAPVHRAHPCEIGPPKRVKIGGELVEAQFTMNQYWLPSDPAAGAPSEAPQRPPLLGASTVDAAPERPPDSG